METRCVFLLFAILSAPVYAQDKDPFPTPEAYVRNGDMAGYVKAAEAFVAKNPGSAHAPRVLFDVYMLGVISKQPALVQRPRAMLLIRYPKSLQGAYMFTTFKDAAELRRFLNSQIDQNFVRMNQNLARAFSVSIREGMARRGPDVIRDPMFLIKVAVVSAEANDFELRNAAVKGLRGIDKRKKYEPLVEICFLEAALADKVAKLEGHRSVRVVPMLQRYYISKMLDKERADPRVMAIEARVALNDNKFAVALPLVEKLLSDETQDIAKLQFWRAWCYTAQRNSAAALLAIEQLKSQHADSPWRAAGDRLEGAIKGLDKNMTANVGAIVSTIGKMKDDRDLLELTMTYKDIRGYMSYDRGVRAEVVIAQGKKTLIAYRAGMTEAMYFTDEDQKAVRFTDPGVYAVPAFSLSGNPEKGFGLNWQFNPQKSLVKFADVLDGLVESEYLNEAAGLRQLLNYAIKRGTLPVGVSTADGRSTYSWIRPRVDEPTFMKMEFQVSDDRLLKLVIGEFTCESIHYGKTDSFQLSPPAWPSVEIVSRKKMDAATMLKLFSAASTLIARFAEESDR